MQIPVPSIRKKFAAAARVHAAAVLLCAVTLRPAAAQQTFQIEPRASTVIYAMEHPMHSWEAVSRSATGMVALEADGAPREVHISIPAMSFDSGNGNRDSHVAETVESYIYKTVTFASTAIEETAAAGDTLTWQVTGDLTFHGVTRSIELPVRVVKEGEALEAIGAFDVTVSEFDMGLPKLLLVPVKDWIGIRFDVVASAGHS